MQILTEDVTITPSVLSRLISIGCEIQIKPGFLIGIELQSDEEILQVVKSVGIDRLIEVYIDSLKEEEKPIATSKILDVIDHEEIMKYCEPNANFSNGQEFRFNVYEQDY